MPAQISYQQHNARQSVASNDVDDTLIFGDFCFSCGNATQGTPYCSRTCRQADSNSKHKNQLVSPDFSPALSAVPPLVPSVAKSVSSTPPSSVNNSPSPLQGIIDVSAEPPQLDLPAPAAKFFAPTSLPILPSAKDAAALSYALSYAHEMSYPGKELADDPETATAQQQATDLTYRRGRQTRAPSQTVPAPLYFRRQAAAHQSPALLPSSPPKTTAATTTVLGFSPKVSPARPPSISSANVSAFALPPRRSSPTLPPFELSQPAVPSTTTNTTTTVPERRRASWTPSTDVLISPRIRALRHPIDEESAIDEDDEVIDEVPPSHVHQFDNEEDVDDNEEQGGHSAFAQYLFSHATTGTSTPDTGAEADDESPRPSPAPRESGTGAARSRGRAPNAVVGATPNSSSTSSFLLSQRSLSADSTLRNKSAVGAGAGRPTRFFFSRGRTDSNPTTDVEVDPEDEPGSSHHHQQRRRRRSNFALEPTSPSSSPSSSPPRPTTTAATVENKSSSSRRLVLQPGRLIQATFSSTPSSVNPSPMPTPPSSPPTSSRGRSTARRAIVAPCSPAGSPTVEHPTPDPRGRSKLRGMGAVKRSMSPAGARDPSKSMSRGRRSDVSHERGRSSRGRSVRRESDEDIEEEEEEEVRGRERGGRGSRERSRSMLRRGRGREVAISGAGYGHGSP
ncbi:hypothetical protein T439DRAFT_383166 [Meredithblackwellia eburnea MCA 4105]